MNMGYIFLKYYVLFENLSKIMNFNLIVALKTIINRLNQISGQK